MKIFCYENLEPYGIVTSHECRKVQIDLCHSGLSRHRAPDNRAGTLASITYYNIVC